MVSEQGNSWWYNHDYLSSTCLSLLYRFPQTQNFHFNSQRTNCQQKHGKRVTLLVWSGILLCFSKMVFSFERWHIKSCQISGIISSQIIWDTFQSSAPRLEPQRYFLSCKWIHLFIQHWLVWSRPVFNQIRLSDTKSPTHIGMTWVSAVLWW